MIDLNEHPSDGAINLDGHSSRVIDLNDVWQPPPRYDLAEVRRRLAATARDWLPALFPNARLSADKKTLRCADLSGRPPRKEGSCVIHLEGRFAGWGFDYATGESAGPIDLIYHATGLTNGSLFEEAARLARMDRPAPPSRPTPAKPDHSLEVVRILDGCRSLAGTPAETYLQGRGLSDPGCPDLLFHPDLTDYEGCRGWPGMVARPLAVTGEPVGGIHRTFLLDDGSGKAPPGKKMLGAIAGGCVRLGPIGADGHLGIAEGIETALSARAIFGVPTWAALSAEGLRGWQWPTGLTHVTIFADAGEAGIQAAAALADRLNIAGITNEIVPPLHGDDFNDDLCRGATVAEQLVTVKTRRGFTRLEWQKLRERNEALDCRVYARAAAWIAGIDRWTERKWRDLEKQLGIEAETTTPTPMPAIPEQKTRADPSSGRRALRSRWLGGRPRNWLQRQ